MSERDLHCVGAVRADAVRDGDVVEWPEGCGVLRRVEEVQSAGTDAENDRHYITAYSPHDGYEYDWIDHQPVVVYRKGSVTA